MVGDPSIDAVVAGRVNDLLWELRVIIGKSGEHHGHLRPPHLPPTLRVEHAESPHRAAPQGDALRGERRDPGDRYRHRAQPGALSRTDSSPHGGRSWGG